MTQAFSWARSLAFALVLAMPVMVVAPTTTAYAQSRPAAGKVDVEILVVQANQTNKVDPRLQSVMNQLRFTKFSGAKLLDTHNEKLAVNSTASISIDGGRKLKVQLVSKTAKTAKLRIQLLQGGEKKFDTTLSIPKGRTVLVGGIKQGANRLLFPVSVNY